MSIPATEAQPPQALLELTVKQHPGVMSRVCGLLVRRGYPVDSLLCLPLEDRRYGHIWIQVHNDYRMPNTIKQLHKLEDVLTVHQHTVPHPIFTQLEVYGRA